MTLEEALRERAAAGTLQIIQVWRFAGTGVYQVTVAPDGNSYTVGEDTDVVEAFRKALNPPAPAPARARVRAPVPAPVVTSPTRTRTR